MAGPQIYLRIQTRAHALSTAEPRTKPVYNVWDFARTTTGGSPSKALAYAAFLTSIMVPFRAALSVSYVTDFADYRWLDDPLDPFTTVALATNGQVAGDSAPSLNNVYCKLSSNLRGGSNRGGKHFGPIAESSTTLDEINAGSVTLFATFAAALVAGFTASDGFIYKPFIVSQKQSTFSMSPAIANVVGVTCVAVTTNPIIGIMTRRAQFRRSSV
jgi:hypothetical protein